MNEFKLLLLESGWSKDSDQVGKWMKVQADILNVLQNNFRDHDDVILDLYRRDVIQHKLLKEFEQLADYSAQETRYHRKLAWIPYGTMCYWAIRKRYIDGGAQDAISKIIDFETAKVFTPSSVHRWSELVEKSWQAVNRIVAKHDASYLAAMQLLMNVQNSDDESWKTFAIQFKSQVKDSPFSVADFIDEARKWNSHLKTSTLLKNSQLTIAANHASAVAKAHNSVAKVCNHPGCTKTVAQNHRWCGKHFIPRHKRDDTQQVPPQIREKLIKKKSDKNKKNWAKKINKTKKDDNEEDSSSHVAIGMFPFGEGATAPTVGAGAHAHAGVARSTPRYTKTIQDKKVKKKKRATSKVVFGPQAMALSALGSSVLSYNPDTNGSFATSVPSGNDFGSLALINAPPYCS